MGQYNEMAEKFQLFKKKYFDDSTLYKDLLEHGQKPHSLVISCADSRVDPALLFQAQPGELFVLRNIANWVPSYEPSKACSVASALSFGVMHLHVAHIIVLGHSHCAGVKTITDKDGISSPILDWTGQITHEGNEEHSMVQKVVINAYQNLFTYPWIKEKTASNDLQCHAWTFDLNHGEVDAYDPNSQDFFPLEQVIS